jgi:pimeloyl-ACP methyl ester carboxylesterase
LVLALHSFASTSAHQSDVKGAVMEIFPDADFFAPDLAIGRFSFRKPLEIALELVEVVNRIWEKKGALASAPGHREYSEVILIGHSLGSLLARKVYVLACGENEAAPFESEALNCPALQSGTAEQWARKVKRIVLLAGINQGWTLSSSLNLGRLFYMGLAEICARVPGLDKHCILAIRRNAPFIVQLRLQWLSMMQNVGRKNGLGKSTTVQLLGSIDDLVSPDDHIDLVTGSEFFYLDVPHTNHSNIIELGGHEKKFRREIFQSALADTPEQLNRTSVSPMDYVPRMVRDEVTDVLFVIHGIRDKGYWTHKLARRVLVQSRDLAYQASMRIDAARGRGEVDDPDALRESQIVVETETSNYGYFAMLPFLLPWLRSAKVGWFMEQYTEARALYPKASFSFVGHSNGTYLLAKAMHLYPSCKFHRVVFAGSVVSANYDWKRLLDSKQVTQVLNYVATSDWVVAIFPRLFQLFDNFGRWIASPAKQSSQTPAPRMERIFTFLAHAVSRVLKLSLFPFRILRQDLGGAGHDGFKNAVVLKPGEKPGIDPMQEIQFILGQHSAALDEDNWRAIADFILKGKAEFPPVRNFKERRPWIHRLLGAAGPVIWLFLLWLVVWLGRGLLLREWNWNLFRFEVWPINWEAVILPGLPLAGFILYCWACWKIVTKV